MKNLIKKSNKICGALLAVLGFSAVYSCGGISYADYFIDGKIVSEETGEAVKELKVSFSEDRFGEDSTYTNEITDENGEFTFNLRGDLLVKYAIKVEDIDGEQNGAFNDITINITISPSELTGGKKQYAGKYYKTFDIKLKPKN